MEVYIIGKLDPISCDNKQCKQTTSLFFNLTSKLKIFHTSATLTLSIPVNIKRRENRVNTILRKFSQQRSNLSMNEDEFVFLRCLQLVSRFPVARKVELNLSFDW